MIIIKTNENVGEFLQNSPTDDIPLRKIKSMDELSGLSKDQYEIINPGHLSVKSIEELKGSSSFNRRKM